jgi:hypothetical protein
VLRIFIALKNPSPWPGSNPQSLGPVASTLTTTPPRRLVFYYSVKVKKNTVMKGTWKPSATRYQYNTCAESTQIADPLRTVTGLQGSRDHRLRNSVVGHCNVITYVPRVAFEKEKYDVNIGLCFITNQLYCTPNSNDPYIK